MTKLVEQAWGEIGFELEDYSDPEKLWWDDIDGDEDSEEDNTTTLKIKVSKKLMRELKLECKNQGTDIQEFVEELLKCSLKQ